MVATIIGHQNLGTNDDVPANVTFVSPDIANGHKFASTGTEKIIIKTSAGGAAGTVTLTSGIHRGSGRSKTVVIPVNSLSQVIIVDDFNTSYWGDADGFVNISYAVGTNCVIAVVK